MFVRVYVIDLDLGLFLIMPISLQQRTNSIRFLAFTVIVQIKKFVNTS